MVDKDQILVCESCGFKDIETKVWVKVNENDRCNGHLEIDVTSNNWCCQCGSHVKIITLTEYEKRQSENE